MHEDITNRKSLKQLLSSQTEFEMLHGKCLLFNRESKNYQFSGIVTAALLDYEFSETVRLFERSQSLTILAINCLIIKQWITFRLNKEDLEEMLKTCDAFIGDSIETSFLLKEEEI